MNDRVHSTKQIILATCLALAGCSSDPATFITYTQQKTPATEAFDARRVARRTDALALNYANSVEEIFRARSTGARYTREGSDTALAGLAAFTGAAESLSISATSLSSMGLASAGILQLRNIFDAKGRSNAYFEAAERIHGAIKDYGAHNLNGVSETELTPNGWTLANVVQSNIDIVNKILNGHLPSPEALAQAMEPMTDKGATPQETGATPANNIPAGGLPVAANRRLEAVMRKLVENDTSGSTKHRATMSNGRLDTSKPSEPPKTPLSQPGVTPETLLPKIDAGVDKKPATASNTPDETANKQSGEAVEKIEAKIHASFNPTTHQITYTSTDPTKVVVFDEKGKPALVSKTTLPPDTPPEAKP